MDLKHKDIQLQFQGFLNTPKLWENDSIFGLEQITLPPIADFVFNEALPNNLRLGKRVERFVGAELKRHNSITIYCENVQIQKEKTTLGELDCILKFEETPVHLEIVYKFYLYDPKRNGNALEHWIGPNKRDTLVKKLNKLKTKQLPLLYNPHTEPVLKALKLHAEDIKQQVYFKAQLFLPYKCDTIDLAELNPNCVSGFYMHFEALKHFKDCKFYIPNKYNWLIEPINFVDWMNYTLFEETMQAFFKKQSAPLCWVKFINGEIKKCFVVWWD